MKISSVRVLLIFMKYIDEFRNPEAAEYFRSRIEQLAGELGRQGKTANIMEVCGSHTMAIGRFGIRELLPENVRLISGPGCPVCVTEPGYIDVLISDFGLRVADLGNTDQHGPTRTNTDIGVRTTHHQPPTTSHQPRATNHQPRATNHQPRATNHQPPIIATFGDMINVPGSESTLADCRSQGAHVEVCYSPLNVLDLAKKCSDREVVFLAIGFETTIAPIMGLLKIIEEQRIENISLLTAFKLVPPALEALVADPEVKIDAFLCPAHVSSIIGSKAYEPFVEKYNIPCVIASFEPVEILYGLVGVLEQMVAGTARVENQYKRFVSQKGNIKAQKLISKYLEPCDAHWRGLGMIPKSGLRLKEEYSQFDAAERFGIKIKPGKPNPGCKCGDVLKGKILPTECPLFAKTCTPMYPIGPCMVSAEGSCAAYFKY